MKQLLKNVQVLGVTCNQWGDTGKGKFVDLFATWANIIARGTGGDNAGHTICCGSDKHTFHIVPSGILFDREGKTNIIGNGTVIYPKTLDFELSLLEKKDLSYNNLMIAWNAKLILPTQIVLDRARECLAGDGKIGSTGKGISPTYGDHITRNGLIVNDLINPDIFRRKLESHLTEKRLLLRNYDPEVIKAIMGHEHLECGLYYSSKNIFCSYAILERYLEYGKKLRYLIRNTDDFLRQELFKGSKILLEGSQGLLLSIDHGTYPFATSSDCTISGLAKGVGLKLSDVDLSLGIIKGFYATRVGRGPFPTEMGGQESDDWCNRSGITKEVEKSRYDKDPIDWAIEFDQGVGIRMIGDEYGGTTGRPRRVGWLDLPLLKYALKYASSDVILTKLDVLDGCESVKVCHEYEYCGPDYNLGNQVIKMEIILALLSLQLATFLSSACQSIKSLKAGNVALRKLEISLIYPQN